MGIGYGLARIGQGIRDVSQANRQRNAEDRQRRLEDLIASQQQEIDALKAKLEARIAETRSQAEQRKAAARSAGQPKPRPLPTSAIEKAIIHDNLTASATRVRDALRDATNPNSPTNATGARLGPLKTPSWLKNAVGMGGDKGKDIRAQIGALFSDVSHQKGGTALSESEIAILEQFVPNEHEDENTALIKANRFIKTLESMKATRLKAYQQYGSGYALPDDEMPDIDRLEQQLPNRHD